MSHRKFLKLRSWLDSIAIIQAVAFALIFHLPASNGFSVYPLGSGAVNCSQHCSCIEEPIDTAMEGYSQKHSVSNPSYYADFFGMTLPVMGSLVKVSCVLADGKMYKVSSLLNGIEAHHYTALDVKCRSNEGLTWDVPVWQVSVNAFTSENCRLIPADTTRGIRVPINMWIMEIYGGGKEQFEELNLAYANNMIALIVAETAAVEIPSSWKGNVLMSMNTVNFRNNLLQKFECEVLFQYHLDSLNLAGNDISVFPECLLNSYHVSIAFLSLARNAISNISALYEVQDSRKPPEINIIDLSHNQIQSLETFRYMPKLTDLDLSYNRIEEVNKESLAGLVNLESLNLENNRIFKIGDAAFGHNAKLASADLSHNALTQVTAKQFPKRDITMTVDLRRNKLQYPPLQDCVNNTLPYFRMRFLSAGNPFHCDCKAVAFEECLQWMESTDANSSSPKTVYMDLEELQCTSPKKTKGKLYTQLSIGNTCVWEEDCPYACQCYMVNSRKLVVNCSGQHLMEMPDMIPMVENMSVVLHLDHNPLQMLCYRYYLRVISELHVHNCLLTTVTPGAIAALQNVRVLTLHNNHLQKLPSSTRNLTLNLAKNVTLHNNRWACSCESLWLPRWITRHRHVLWAPGKIVCSYLRKPVEQFTDLDVNCSNAGYMEKALVVSLAISTVVSTLIILFYYRSEISQLIYSRFGVRCCNTFSYADHYSPYDAFVSYSQDNYKWIVDVLVPVLENGHNKYRLCMHYRDFPAGEPAVENIPWAMRLSRCSILLLSRDFLAKEWAIQELRAAFQRLLFTSNRLIVVVTEDIQMEELTPDLRAYMSTHEYLRLGEPNFWSKLEFFLPPPRYMPSADMSSETPTMGDAGGDNDKKLQPSFSLESPLDIGDASIKPYSMADTQSKQF